MIRIFIIIYFFSITILAQPQQKRICITVDDLPTVAYGVGGDELKMKITKSLVSVFKEYHIPAIGYVNEGKLYNSEKLNPNEVALLEIWLSNGLELGNHTYSHFSYNTVSFEEYTADLLKGEQVTRKLAEKHKLGYKYFRHPFLHVGATQGRADSLAAFLKDHQYIAAPVTIDNTDYLFAKAYSDAYKTNNTGLMKRIGETYVDYMEEKVIFYEKISTALFGRNIDQTLLIHASLLNADYIETLVQRIQKHGYSFVSQTEVLKDPAYQTTITTFGRYGISWLDRWALSQGKRADFFEGDPETPEFILELNK